MTTEMPMSNDTVSKPAPLWLRVWRNQSFRTIGFMILRIVAFILLMFVLSKAMRWLMPFKPLKPDRRWPSPAANCGSGACAR